MPGSGSWLRLIVMLQMVIYMEILCASPAAVAGHSRKLAALVEESSTVLTYYDGPLLSTSGVIPVHLIWYGKFTPVQRSLVGDFLQSLGAKVLEGKANQPSASTWWKTTEKYEGTASKKAALSSVVMFGKQKVDQDYSLGKSLRGVTLLPWLKLPSSRDLYQRIMLGMPLLFTWCLHRRMLPWKGSV